MFSRCERTEKEISNHDSHRLSRISRGGWRDERYVVDRERRLTEQSWLNFTRIFTWAQYFIEHLMLGHVLSLGGEAATYESKCALKISSSYRPVPRIRNSLRPVYLVWNILHAVSSPFSYSSLPPSLSLSFFFLLLHLLYLIFFNFSSFPSVSLLSFNFSFSLSLFGFP